ncbi:2-amino-4-hydroxy-6-hydroxymethyldihydropteridine diphosphokinase [Limimaricola hongkongensis]|uniref:2-amino-4-hydroxy-6-hydroxymethyldihydropteridine pyrophosphokinase n=1 Tax=Limimaricola hongkongensis DSM 17492 TaxID=1122180 RepID=A0A017HFW1_9RHOB|nr:2-amino-4-hydroxy-6-hydroxymethyldihydropteridine diphosphokinase [Limimaricola hongkongensis]EYD73023.1 2-amino-4-hydroxy-6- hydroxymethyldihydropteridine pyrophosphokinase [Limimaricola hongkongensis DSM 17492]
MPHSEQSDAFPARALIALGANAASPEGPPAATLRAAMAAVARLGRGARRSRLWRSPAFPAGSGPDFVNAAMAIETDRPAAELLAALHAIEARFGRERQARWGPRSLDLDLLALGAQIAPDLAGWTLWRDLPLERQSREAPDRLILPHPRLQDRGFVLVPLAEVAPGWRHPVTGLDVMAMRDALPAQARAELAPLG